MIFLIEYNRLQGKIVKIERFDNLSRSRAEKIRLDIELDLSHKLINHEVVLLDAVSEKAVRRTHRRYFENVSQIAAL
ncbi:MAG: hypothetical protein A3I11_05335 [Elusimicrobia bacterium RIFCSPLOWO2_02_FULL_39_32]|nr:MAG: hypothetical protein A3B80_00270 [Elusimicrobia bacterium RIFCSPHIGHO2_02_FULL_39_36]OGR91171.1 MAG: hypothetical protein A3I11_05335 [Elusimicrobia bacterium RIFCSPLOWO2_02_FULL_39_32]OGS00139.1 MAG: hypothetical protein A3G85_08300 [Elusimicrobia bacterium RIFCSPLOWO2_12_FULL_39_28]